MAELIWRLRSGRTRLGAQGSDLSFGLLAGGATAVVLGVTITVSLQAACALALVVVVVALHQYNRAWGVTALFVLWLLVPGIRRLFGLTTGFVNNDPLSLAPFLATCALATNELLRVHVPTNIRRVLLLAAGGFAMGLPVGFVAGPRAAVFAFIAYAAGVMGAVLGIGEGTTVQASTLRRILLFAIPPIAIYAIFQRAVHLPEWDQYWLDASGFDSAGVSDGQKVRVFGTLNSPGTLAPLLGMTLLCYLTVHKARAITIASAGVVAVALSYTFVRSAWFALIAAGIAHVVVSRGASARIVLGSAAVIVAATLALAPISPTANEVLERFKTIQNLGRDDSATTRSATLDSTLPTAISAPLGHGLGMAGESSKLSGTSDLRAPDNGYLGLMYQVGPIGFLMVMGALGYILIAAWNGARARAPGEELRWLLFAILIYLMVLLAAGDEFYGSHGVILWFIGGSVMAYDFRRRQAEASVRRQAEVSARRAAETAAASP